LTFSQPPVILRDRILIARRDILRRGCSHLPGLRFVVVPKLQFQLVHIIQDFRVELFHHRRIARKPRWIEVLHLAGQVVDLFLGYGIALRELAQLIQLTHALVDGQLPVRWVWAGLWSTLAPRRVVPLASGIDIEVGDIASTTATELSVRDVATLLSTTALAGLSTLPTALASLVALAGLTWLATLSSLLPFALLALASLAGLLALLSALLSLLTCAVLLTVLP
jgi:hypothetical protein